MHILKEYEAFFKLGRTRVLQVLYESKTLALTSFDSDFSFYSRLLLFLELSLRFERWC